MLSALPLGLLLLGGATLPEAPVIAPGSVPIAQATLDEGIALHKRGDSAAAIAALEGWLASGAGPYGRDRSAGRFLLGWLYMDKGQWNLASAQFTSVRVAGGPLAMHGAWFEAWTDHQRGRHTVAAGECASYRSKWPDGPHAEECLVLRGDALVAAGQKGAAIAAYKEYLALNPDTPRAEELRLGMALAEANANPERGAMLLKTMTVDFDHPCSAVAAQAALDSLLEEESLDEPSLGAVREAQLRAVSLRDCGLKDEAMALYKEIGAENPDDAQVQAWQAAQGGTFAWRTKQYRALGDSFARKYKASPNSEDAWYAFRAYFRGGYFEESAVYGELGLDKHSKSGRFRNVRDVVAHTQQMAGNYERAREHWEVLAKGRGSVAAAATWFAAFDTYRMGEYEAAIARMDPIVAKGGETGLSARYYRGKSYSALKNRDKAAEDYSWIRRNASNTWYALLLNSKWRKGLAEMPPELLREGRNPAPSPALEAVASPAPNPVGSAVPARVAGRTVDPEPEGFDWSHLAWGAEPSQADLAPVDPVPVNFPLAVPQPEIADSYAEGAYVNPAAYGPIFRKVANQNEKVWPLFPAAFDLATVGVYELSGELMADIYEEYEFSVGRRNARQQQVRAVNISKGEWRASFVYSQDHHHATRFSLGIGKSQQDPEELKKALRLGYPTAHKQHVERWARTYNVDPLLAYGLMRRESLYRSTALSHAGAIGVMQIMPRTGSKVAYLLGLDAYTPADLERPEVNVQYGVFYLSQLLTRFEGCWPMAVASYNAGPVNVSSWYRPWKGKIELDDWVEQIPLREPRTYVKKVSENYSVYVDLYAPEDAVLHVPRRGGEDKPEVIDF